MPDLSLAYCGDVGCLQTHAKDTRLMRKGVVETCAGWWTKTPPPWSWLNATFLSLVPTLYLRWFAASAFRKMALGWIGSIANFINYSQMNIGSDIAWSLWESGGMFRKQTVSWLVWLGQSPTSISKKKEPYFEHLTQNWLGSRKWVFQRNRPL